MKYTAPSYKNESVEVRDVIQASIVSIAYTQTTIIDSVTKEEKKVTSTRVTVDVSGLF